MTGLVDAIVRRCREHGGEPILRSGGGSLSAADFLDHAQSLRRTLVEAGIDPGARVAIRFGPCAQLPMAVLGCWLAGASFVPVDPQEAPARQDRILADSAARVLLEPADPAEPDPDGRQAGIRLTVLDPPADAGPRWPDEAYVIYTSGSSGMPKGVSVGHRPLTGYLNEVRRRYGIPESGMAVAMQLPATFDASLTCLLLPLITRNAGHPITDPIATRGLASFLAEQPGEVLVKLTPSQLKLLTELAEPRLLPRLAGVFILGGEALDYRDLHAVRSATKLRIYNEYGPTEATVGCCSYQVRQADPATGPVPIGWPHHGVQLLLATSDDEPAIDGGPVIERGELVIAGPVLANGYLRSPPDSGFGTRDGRPCYRTGDLASVDGSGRFHYHGRLDDQRKVNGIRVELGEVEAAVRLAAGCQQAVAAATADRIVAGYLGTADPAEVAARLTGLLPSALRPGRLIRLAELPLTGHGKLDRAALLTAAGPPGAVPERVRDIRIRVGRRWSKLLGVAMPDGTDSFFDAGDSLAALRLTGQLQAELGRPVPVRLLFDHPVLDDFVRALLDRAADDPAGADRAVDDPAGADRAAEDPAESEPVDMPGPGRALVAARTAVFAAERLGTEPAMFTVVDAVSVTGIRDWIALGQAVSSVLDRHQVFGWRFAEAPDGGTVSWLDPAPERPAPELRDLRGRPDAAAALAAGLLELRARDCRSLSGPAAARPSIVLFRLSERTGVCALLGHHAVLDEHSGRLIWQQAFTELTGSQAEPGEPAAAELPVECSPAGDSSGASPLRFGLPAGLTGRLSELAREHGCPLATVLGLAAVRAFGETVGRRRFPVVLPMTLRRRPEDFDTVGCLVSAVPVAAVNADRSEPAAVALGRWQDAVRSAGDQAAADPASVADPLRQAAETAVRISLAFEAEYSGRAGDVRWRSLEPPDGPAKYDLALQLRIGERPGEPIRGRLVWRPAVADRAGFAQQLPSFPARFAAQCELLCAERQLPPIPVREQPATADGMPALGRSAAQAERIAALAGRVLGRTLTAEADLFRAGARSLDLLRLSTELTETYRVEVSPVDLFDFPTPAALADLIRSRRPAADDAVPADLVQPADDAVPPDLAQPADDAVPACLVESADQRMEARHG